MEVSKKRITRNNTFSAIPVTKNYLVRSSSGNLHWKKPNDSFVSIANTGGNRQVISNIQFDNSEHTPNLFVYTNVVGKDMRHVTDLHKNNAAASIAESSRIQLDRSRNWYVKQLTNLDRVGVQRFTQLPVQAFLSLWRAPLDPKEITITPMKNRTVRFEYRDFKFQIFLKWDELDNDMNASPSKQGHSTIILPWLKKNCRGGIYLFSDYTSMFEDPTDEVTYIIDVC